MISPASTLEISEKNEPHKYLLLVILSLIYIIFAKLGNQVEMSLWIVLIPITVSVMVMTLLSPPVATALVFMSHNLIGQITLSHPGMLIQVFPAASLFIFLIYKRRYELFIEGTFWQIKRPEALALLGILLVFIIGFFTSIFSQMDMMSFQTLSNLFKASNGGKQEYYPYVFLSRWGAFILLGSLSCRGARDVKIFFLAFAIFSITQLIAIPIPVYEKVLSNICLGVTGDGLQVLNINRAYLGYLLSGSSFILLAFSMFSKKWISFLSYILAFILMFFCILAGAKGPYLALFLAIVFLIIIGGKKIFYKLTFSMFILITLVVVTTFPLGCKNSYMYFSRSYKATTSSSVAVRLDLAKGVYTQSSKKSIFNYIFGKGLGASLVNVPVVILNPGQKPITTIMGSGSHNMFFDLWIDLGYFGVAIFIFSLFTLVFCFYKNIPFEKTVSGVLMGGFLLILLVYSILATAPSLATIQALIVGILFGVNIKTSKNETIL